MRIVSIVAALAVGLAASVATAQVASPAGTGGDPAMPAASTHDPAWGHYSALVGRSARASTGYAPSMRWYWASPGKELVQEYRDQKTGKVVHREVITLGATPGTLVMQGSAWGKREWDATVQPDGGVLFVARGMLKTPHVAGFVGDGTWARRLVKLRDGAIEPVDQVLATFQLEPATEAAAGVARADAASPVESGDGSSWGPYARLAGLSTAMSPGGTSLHWSWQVPGQALLQEYRKADGTVVRRDLITRGAAPGTLVLELQGGVVRAERLSGTVQPDGGVLFRSEHGMKQYVASLVDGAWELRPVQVRGNSVVPLDGASRFPLDSTAMAQVQAPAEGTPAVAGAHGATADAEALPGVAAESPAQAAASVDADPAAASVQEPETLAAGAPASIASASGQPLDADAARAAAMLERLFAAWLAGHQPAEDMIERLRQSPVTRDMAALGPAKEIRYTARAEVDNGYAFDVAHANAKAHWTLYLDRDSGLIQNIRWKPLPPFAGERPLANPAAWGRVALMANASVLQGANTRYYRVSPDGHAIYVLNVHESGHVVPEEILRPVGDGTFVRRRYQHPGTTRETFYRGQAMDDQTMRWGHAEMSEDFAYHDWTIPAHDASRFIFTVYRFDEVRSSREYRMGAKLHAPDSLGDAIAKAQAQDVGIVARYQQRRAEFLANNSGATSNPWARALYDGLSAATLAARESEARSRAQLDATLAQMQAQAALDARATQPAAVAAVSQVDPATVPPSGARAGGARPASAPGASATAAGNSGTATAQAPSASGAAKPLRFVLTIGMRNLPGDAHNSVCYSNVITRPGPLGWGAPGFLPTGSSEQAIAEINRLKSQFIGLCRASGREITSEGNFSWVMNRSADDDARVDATAPRHAEDVEVRLR